MVVPLFVGRQKSIAALEAAMAGDQSILLAAQKDAKTNDPSAEDIHVVGTVGTVVQLLRLPDGTVTPRATVLLGRTPAEVRERWESEREHWK